jgi:hypothetical protein
MLRGFVLVAEVLLIPCLTWELVSRCPWGVLVGMALVVLAIIQYSQRQMCPRQVLPSVATLALLSALAGCSSDGENRCIQGASVECACPDGNRGIQSCQPDGTFTDCACASPAARAGPDQRDAAFQEERPRDQAAEHEALALQAEIEAVRAEIKSSLLALDAARTEPERARAKSRLASAKARAEALHARARGEPASGASSDHQTRPRRTPDSEWKAVDRGTASPRDAVGGRHAVEFEVVEQPPQNYPRNP